MVTNPAIFSTLAVSRNQSLQAIAVHHGPIIDRLAGSIPQLSMRNDLPQPLLKALLAAIMDSEKPLNIYEARELSISQQCTQSTGPYAFSRVSMA